MSTTISQDTFQWKYEEPDIKKVQALQDALQIHPKICEILTKRGIETYDEAKAFFRPKIEALHDPYLMKGMHKAISRIQEAIDQNEHILIYGDYDVDGTTAASLVYLFLSQITSSVNYYFPDRQKEGYGISFEGIDFAEKNNFSLVIALDCGIKSIDKIEYANQKGIDFIICDHHQPGDEIPEAVAILNPKQEDCPYPYKELSGCGIGFKLTNALCSALSLPLEKSYQYLDLVAISIAADIVPITGENRVLASLGLQKVNESPLPGIKQLIEIGGLKSKITITDLVFVVAPRINAAGRLSHASEIAHLLTETDHQRALQKAQDINLHNLNRKDLDSSITEEALEILDLDSEIDKKRTTVVYQPHWHKGVIGIVASRLIENYYKPTIVFTKSEGKLVASARSVRGYNLYEAIDACKEHVIQFGGHKYAAGITLKEEKLEDFKNAFERYVQKTIQPEHLTPVIIVDAEIISEDITQTFFNIIEQMSPFGPGNMRPNFLIKNMIDTGNTRIVKDLHLKIEVYDPSNPKRKIKGIGFNLSEKYHLLQNNEPVDIVFQLSLNTWNGMSNIEMKVKDIKPSKD